MLQKLKCLCRDMHESVVAFYSNEYFTLFDGVLRVELIFSFTY